MKSDLKLIHYTKEHRSNLDQLESLFPLKDKLKSLFPLKDKLKTVYFYKDYLFSIVPDCSFTKETLGSGGEFEFKGKPKFTIDKL